MWIFMLGFDEEMDHQREDRPWGTGQWEYTGLGAQACSSGHVCLGSALYPVSSVICSALGGLDTHWTSVLWPASEVNRDEQKKAECFCGFLNRLWFSQMPRQSIVREHIPAPPLGVFPKLFHSPTFCLWVCSKMQGVLANKGGDTRTHHSVWANRTGWAPPVPLTLCLQSLVSLLNSASSPNPSIKAHIYLFLRVLLS